MRLAVFVVVLVVGCKGEKAAPPPPTVTAIASGSAAPLSGWERVEALAIPVASPSPTKDLERAIEIAQKHRDAWRGLRDRDPRTPAADYPEGSEALAALEAWAAANGGLPELATPLAAGSFALAASEVGKLAIAASTPERETARLAVQLGATFVEQGRSLLELQTGLSILAHAKRERGEPIIVDADFVRIIAADALFARRTAAFLLTPEGKRTFEASLAEIDPMARNVVEGSSGKKLEELAPDKAQAAAFEGFWLAGLDGAQRGEAVAVTFARVRTAADAADPSIQYLVRSIPTVLERMKQEIDALAAGDASSDGPKLRPDDDR